MNADIAGRIQLFPGRGLPAIASSRPALVERVAAGRSAQALPALMGALHSLCAMPHRMASAAAVAAAHGQPFEVTLHERQQLRASQAREQVLRIAHDWARLWPGLPGTRVAASALGACPLWQAALGAEQQMQALPQWLAEHWLGCSTADWLQSHDRDTAHFVADWCDHANTPLARLLRDLRDDALRLSTPQQPLSVLADVEGQLPLLASGMLHEPGFCARPHWAGATCDTGPWSRVNDVHPHAAGTAWQRLVSRVVDVLRLAAPGGEHWLAQGAITLRAGTGMAWVEMARGLLVHMVVLEADGSRVAACRVLAPTEWNFHPEGGLAHALSRLTGRHAADDASRLAVAYDPCVAFDVVPASQREAAHA